MTCCLQESLVAGFPEATAVCLAGIAAADVKILQGRLRDQTGERPWVLRRRQRRRRNECAIQSACGRPERLATHQSGATEHSFSLAAPQPCDLRVPSLTDAVE